jgi:hypothetical protein
MDMWAEQVIRFVNRGLLRRRIRWMVRRHRIHKRAAQIIKRCGDSYDGGYAHVITGQILLLLLQGVLVVCDSQEETGQSCGNPEKKFTQVSSPFYTHHHIPHSTLPESTAH